MTVLHCICWERMAPALLARGSASELHVSLWPCTASLTKQWVEVASFLHSVDSHNLTIPFAWHWRFSVCCCPKSACCTMMGQGVVVTRASRSWGAGGNRLRAGTAKEDLGKARQRPIYWCLTANLDPQTHHCCLIAALIAAPSLQPPISASSVPTLISDQGFFDPDTATPVYWDARLAALTICSCPTTSLVSLTRTMSLALLHSTPSPIICCGITGCARHVKFVVNQRILHLYESVCLYVIT